MRGASMVVMALVAAACGSRPNDVASAEVDSTGGDDTEVAETEQATPLLTFGNVTFWNGEESGPSLAEDGRVMLGSRHVATLAPDGTVHSVVNQSVVARLHPDGRLEFTQPGTETNVPVIAEDGTLTMGEHQVAFDESGHLTGLPESTYRAEGLTPENRRAAMMVFLMYSLLMPTDEPAPPPAEAP